VKTAKLERLVSLDLLRGLAVIGMILVNSMAGMQDKGRVFPTLLHSRWDGVTLADVVFPAFLFMVGVSIPLSLRGKPGDPSEQYSRILWRCARLILLGFVLSNQWWFIDFEGSSWRLFGVLQRIGLVYAACALLFLWCAPRTRLIIAGAILILYWPITLIPSLDGLPNDIWARGHNFVGSIDRVLLGTHLYVQGPDGYDPEGFLGTLPAIAQGLIGLAIGEYLLRGAERGRLRAMAIAGAAMLVAGVAWGFVFTVVKDIWSSSFVLVTSGITTLVLALLSYLFDGRPMDRGRRVAELIVLPFGMNAIAAYVLHEVTWALLGWDLFQLPYRELAPALGTEVAAFAPVGLYMLLIWLCMFYLWRRRWFFRI
jgi:predicted acyltransferase